VASAIAAIIDCQGFTTTTTSTGRPAGFITNSR
jgi:hypothetical protein